MDMNTFEKDLKESESLQTESVVACPYRPRRKRQPSDEIGDGIAEEEECIVCGS